MESKIADPVPGVADADLVAVVRSLPSLPTTDATDADRFIREVRAISERRAQAGWPAEGDHDMGAFVLVPYPRAIREKVGGQPILDLIATASPILGKVFFLSRDASNGTVIDFPVTPTAIIEWITDMGFGECTVVLVYRSQACLAARRGGAADHVRYDAIRNKPPQGTASELEDALALFHRAKVLIPSLCPAGVWEPNRAHNYVPGPQPERCIQREMVSALNFWFRGVVRAEIEDATDIGRIDVRLLQANNDRLYYWAIIELKVIKSKRNASGRKAAGTVSLAENAETVAEGIRQAHAFHANRRAEIGLLEVFDLRQDKHANVMAHRVVVQALGECNPTPMCRVRDIFGSAADARRAGWT